MNRSPLFYPMNRGMDSDAGGAAELQTDVMRFMAIISMCLVAIFALVQSIPLAPQSPPTAPEEKPEPQQAAEPADDPGKAADAPVEPVALQRPEPGSMPEKAAPVVLERPVQAAAKPVEATPPRTRPPAAERQPQRRSATESPSQQGFTLRFESDAVLTRLVEDQTVGLYVMAGGQARRLQIESGRISFWSSSTPDQVHEMDPATVPKSLVTTWNRQHGSGGIDEKWGVSLPPSMSRQVRNHLAGGDGGELIIGAGGQVRLER